MHKRPRKGSGGITKIIASVKETIDIISAPLEPRHKLRIY